MTRLLLALATSCIVFAAVVPKPAPSNDGVIEGAIRAKFAKSKINEEHFKVTVRNGIALLEGKTAVPQRKGAATRMAKTGGAKEVVNKIEVSQAARQQMADRLRKARERKTPAAASLDQPAISAKTAATADPSPPALRRMQIKP